MSQRAKAAKKASWVLAVALATTTLSWGLQSSAFSAPTVNSATFANSPNFAEATVHWLLVSIPDRKLALLENGKVVRIYRVAVGKAATPSPTGSFKIVNRVTNPAYYHKGRVIPTGEGNPVGSRWIGLSAKGYGIHGTNQPNSIGKAASTGCIRMSRRDLEELFERVSVGDTVEIRDEQVAQIFSGAPGTETLAEVRTEGDGINPDPATE